MTEIIDALINDPLRTLEVGFSMLAVAIVVLLALNILTRKRYEDLKDHFTWYLDQFLESNDWEKEHLSAIKDVQITIYVNEICAPILQYDPENVDLEMDKEICEDILYVFEMLGYLHDCDLSERDMVNVASTIRGLPTLKNAVCSWYDKIKDHPKIPKTVRPLMYCLNG